MPSSYLNSHFTLRHALTATVSRWFPDTVYTARHGLVKGMRRKGGLGFLPSFLTRSIDDTPEVRFLAELDLRGAVVYDIGGFQGLMTLYFSRQAERVITFEPNPANYNRIIEHLQLNKVTNVLLRKVAVGDSDSQAALVYDPLMPGAGSADPNVSGQIRDTAARYICIKIHTVRLDDEVRNGLPKPDFIKIDVEGMELSALRSAQNVLRERQPDLYLEVHGTTDSEKKRNVGQIVCLLRECGYADIMHVETGRTVVADDCAFACRGHLYCRSGQGTG